MPAAMDSLDFPLIHFPSSFSTLQASHLQPSDMAMSSNPSDYVVYQKFARTATKNRGSGQDFIVRNISADLKTTNVDAIRVSGYNLISYVDCLTGQSKVEMLRDVPHHGVFPVKHCFLVDNTIWLIYPQSDWITLNGMMRSDERVFDEVLIASVMKQILSVLQYLHSRGESWFDIRPEHLLLESDGRIRVILHSLRSIVQQKTRDSLPYVAPEQLQPIEEDRVGESRLKADIWALGVTAIALYIAHAPYEQLPLAEITACIQDGSPVNEIPNAASLTPQFKQFLDMALDRDMAARASAEILLTLPFIENAPDIDYVAQQLSPEVGRFRAANPPVEVNAHDQLSVSGKGPQNKITDLTHHERSSSMPSGLVSKEPKKLAHKPLPATLHVKTHSNNHGSSNSHTNAIPKLSHSEKPKSPLAQSTGSTTPVTAPLTPTASSSMHPPSQNYQPRAVNRATITHSSEPSPAALQSSQASTTRQGEETTDVPIETYLGETPTEFVVLVRAIPGTQVQLSLHARSMLIIAALPPLTLPQPNLMTLRAPVRMEYEKRVQFPSYVNANNYSKSYDKSGSLLTVRIRKFIPVDLGTETF